MRASLAAGPTHDPQRGRLTGLGLGRCAGGEPGLVAVVEMDTPLHVTDAVAASMVQQQQQQAVGVPELTGELAALTMELPAGMTLTPVNMGGRVVYMPMLTASLVAPPDTTTAAAAASSSSSSSSPREAPSTAPHGKGTLVLPPGLLTAPAAAKPRSHHSRSGDR